MQQNRTNVLSFQLASGGLQWFIVGWYIASDCANTIKRVIATISQHPRWAALQVAGDFNTDLATPEGSNCGEEIAAAIAKDIPRTSSHATNI